VQYLDNSASAISIQNEKASLNQSVDKFP